ncbi:hypothetical protein AURDEDRAFT_74152 [Auricularia subglabra TFB-10046 SS5]|uniref:Fungal-type protein kinase domain-containing protein n=1 Tax=Auricularia subglabra (strain TFB-10046 / SS5) TaxID=717982 RepID=J0CYT6_AURST|nr:hypothetical protein AURDEDRAFT_74152 [Auricularia subglabra TFB-10046 SS5]
MRGHDTTVEDVTNNAGLQTVRVSLGLGNDAPLYRIPVGGENYYVSRPFTHQHIYPIGRGTRCYTAYEAQSGRLVLLKDTWRVEAYTREGEVYELLSKNSVHNIPGMKAHGDVQPDEPLQACGQNDGPTRRHVHYRLVLDTVGRALSDFRSTWELVRAVKGALRAHRDATRLRVTHRDISAGNIIIDENGGLLIDWELAKMPDDGEARAYERTGTRQFMSLRLLADPSAPQETRDDLESFVHVFMWTACKHAASTMSAKTRTQALQNYDVEDEGRVRANQVSSWSALDTWELASGKLYGILEELRAALCLRYDADRGRTVDPAEAAKLLTHDWMMELLEEALKDDAWRNLADEAVPYVPYSSTDDTASKKRRASSSVQRDAEMKKRRVSSPL